MTQPCPHCHTQNRDTAQFCAQCAQPLRQTCSQCGALIAEGTERASGQTLGAHRHEAAEPITCPACGTSNDSDAPRCVQCGASLVQPKPEPAAPKAEAAPAPKARSRTLGVSIGVILLLAICAACIAFLVLSGRTEDTTAQVQAVEWTRNIAVEGLVPVTAEGWRNEIPAGTLIGVCTEKVHHTERRTTGETREICGTPYTVDTGSGYGEVVQDCTTEEIFDNVPVYAESCQYTVEVWQKVDQATLRGNDSNPKWPRPQLRGGQREGQREESYTITFRTEQGTYTYSTSNAGLFTQARVGSRWILKVNTFNTVTDIERTQ